MAVKYKRILKKTSPLMKGDDVKYIQELLIKLGYNVGSTKADGQFGTNTESAVKSFQKSHKDSSGKLLTVDGKVGEKTWNSIVDAANGSSTSSSDGTKYTRLLKKTSPLMKGNDVKYIQELLIDLGYSVGNTKADGQYGDNTVSAVKSFQKDHKLTVDGIVGPDTWNAIVKAHDDKDKKPVDEGTKPSDGHTYTRLLKKGMSGADVRYMKDCLYSLNYLKVKPTHNTFGTDTYNAVLSFQKSHKLTVDGIIGEKTWSAIVKEVNGGASTKYLTTSDYPHIAEKNLNAINDELQSISSDRIAVVKEVLKYAYDDDKGGDVVALYVFGQNLYNTDLKLNVATASMIDKAAKVYPSYFNGGRKEWMKEEIKKNPYLPAADCSGMEVGYLRKFKYVKSSFDTTANNFCSNSYSTSVSKSNLLPGDWVGKDGHIGTYVGAGLVVEFAGGAYGCQLTKLDKRQCRNMMTGKLENMAGWTKFRNPKYY